MSGTIEVSDRVLKMIAKGGSQNIVKTGGSYYVNIPKFLFKNAFWEIEDSVNIKFIQVKGILIIYNPSAQRRVEEFYKRMRGET